MAKQNPAELDELKRSYEASILEGMARTLWVMAYAYYVEQNDLCEYCDAPLTKGDDGTWVDDTDGDACPEYEHGHQPRGEVRVGDEDVAKPGPGADFDDAAPDTPPVAEAAARSAAQMITAQESMSLADFFELAMTVDQGEFEWFEEGRGGEDSAAKQKQRERKHEDAHEFGSALAHMALGSGVSWGDDRRTRRDGAVFEPRFPSGEIALYGHELSWYFGSYQGRGPIDRRIAISYEIITPESAERGWEDEIGALVDGEDGYDNVVHQAVDMLREGVRNAEPSSTHFHPGIWYTAYQHEPSDYATGARRNRSFHLRGFSPVEEEWIFYFYTGKIGRITLVNEPWSSESFSYRGRGGPQDESQNFLFWFARAIGNAGGPHVYLLVFGNTWEDAFGEAVDWLSEHQPAFLANDEVNERYRELERELCDEKGLPDADMLSDRDRERIRDESEEDMVTGGNASDYLRSDEHGLVGQDMTLDQLRQFGMLERNPGLEPNSPPKKQAGPGMAGYQRRRELARDVYPAKIRQRRADPRWQDPNSDHGECSERCPGWAVFDTDRGLGVQACDECNASAKRMGLPIIHEEDVRELDDARILMARAETGDSRWLDDSGRRRRNPSSRRQWSAAELEQELGDEPGASSTVIVKPLPFPARQKRESSRRTSVDLNRRR